MGHDVDTWFAVMFVVVAAFQAVKRHPGDYVWILIIVLMVGYLAFECLRASRRRRKNEGDGRMG
ncbi:protein of unknown function [Bradyrhizobium sp. ORS 285]|uniref:hypothetical protein n=1 Tax=Bradyrhizobium sp. ORS 285 TaxID=115808 RepID=UPI0002407891|nr:hypothetical protein [Bradyrhizobium sp. ORS 285]CCD85589.1 hypothetical protein BRAO285_1500002 [Bradyrhizobium sp. ORS 285]SMX62023.1 protein of unknown function [Bradyrhizobium sp. ORS 285]